MSDTAPNLPYQAYKVCLFPVHDFQEPTRRSQSDIRIQAPIRRHGYGAPNVSTPTTASRPASVIAPTTPPPTQTSQNGSGYATWEKEAQTTFAFSKSPQSPTLPVIVLEPSPPPASPGSTRPWDPTINGRNEPSLEPARVNGSHSTENGASAASGSGPTQSPPQTSADLPGSSSAAPAANSEDRPRKTSTFRRVPRNTRTPLPSSPLAGGHARTVSSSSMASSSLRPSLPPSEHPSYTQQRPTSMFQSSSPSTNQGLPAPSEQSSQNSRRHSTPLNADAVAASLASVDPPARTSSLNAQHVSPPSTAPMSRVPSSSIPTRQTTPAPTPASVPPSPSSQLPPRQASAPYRPGFQPKGVYRPRTDEFIEHRKAHAISAGYASAERTKLERRLEKLVALHFPEESKAAGVGVGRRPGIAPVPNTNRRASSFFDLDLKSFLGGGGGKEDVRTAEQRITPWQEDSTVSKCPLCTTNFHPLTNRKHHCRLCGQIICALPVKRPQRPQPCSLLFVVDPKTRNIEEVGEGVDYGVRKRRTGSVGGAKELQEEAAEEEKFLRGVRICRECRPVLLRQQHQQQNLHVPAFVKLYEAFLILEKEIEDSLPQFQELILSLNHESQPTKEASAARKRLLEAFAQYDSLAKRIRNLPTPNGRGSSQERVQIAVMTRANLFLQKNMFPLQVRECNITSLYPRRSTQAPLHARPCRWKATTTGATLTHRRRRRLHYSRCLSRRRLLETFVEEAKAQRKFEDAKTLRVNLAEIRAEIERVVGHRGHQGEARAQGAVTFIEI
ncbi:FYVE zinc finger-domain-containing protein [Mycena galericulata]|nr:FYVE zinc finger-domain-containing protein [Mycena galericulata]